MSGSVAVLPSVSVGESGGADGLTKVLHNAIMSSVSVFSTVFRCSHWSDLGPGVRTWARPLWAALRPRFSSAALQTTKSTFPASAFASSSSYLTSLPNDALLVPLHPHPTVHSLSTVSTLSPVAGSTFSFVPATVFILPLRYRFSTTVPYVPRTHNNNQRLQLQSSTDRLDAIPIPIAIMKSAIFTASLLASGALALAHQHQHARHHNKRQGDVVWITDYDYVTEIVGLTTTYWVSAGETITASPTHKSHESHKTEPAATTTSDGAPQFFQGSSSVAAAPAPKITTTTVAPAPVVVESTSAPPPPAPETTTSNPPPPPPAPTTLSTSTTVAAPPAPSTSTPPSSGSGSSSGGQCSESSPCAGDITYYDTGLGACGITSTNDQKVVALPHGFMGTLSNDNPYCGRTIAIKCDTTGKTSTATVVDKCMGCDGMSIDLSPAVFDDLASEAVGRTTATWYFTD